MRNLRRCSPEPVNQLQSSQQKVWIWRTHTMEKTQKRHRWLHSWGPLFAEAGLHLQDFCPDQNNVLMLPNSSRRFLIIRHLRVITLFFQGFLLNIWAELWCQSSSGSIICWTDLMLSNQDFIIRRELLQHFQHSSWIKLSHIQEEFLPLLRSYISTFLCIPSAFLCNHVSMLLLWVLKAHLCPDSPLHILQL